MRHLTEYTNKDNNKFNCWFIYRVKHTLSDSYDFHLMGLINNDKQSFAGISKFDHYEFEAIKANIVVLLQL